VPSQLEDEVVPLGSEVEAKTLGLDEGRATAFAELARAARRAATLQRVTALLSGAAEHNAVLDAIVSIGIESLGGSAGAVAGLSADEREFLLLSAVGYPAGVREKLQQLPIDAHPMAREFLVTRQPLFFRSHKELEQMVPAAASLALRAGASAVLPLCTARTFLGVFLLTFADEREFATDEREFLMALSEQCAIALERAQLYERERAARKDAEAATALLADALESMTDMHFVVDESWRYVRFNRAARQFFQGAGFDPDALVDRIIWEEFPLLIGGEMHTAMHRAVQDRVTVRFTAASRYTDTWYEGYAYPLRDGVAVYAHDVTERKRAEREIERLNETLRHRLEEMETLLRLVPVGIGIAKDAECREVVVNPAFAAMLGISPEVNASKSADSGATLPFRVQRDGHDVPADHLPLQRAAASGRAVIDWEGDIVRTDGHRLTLVESAVPVFDGQGRTIGSVGAFVDITERKRAETEARLLSEASVAFAASLDPEATLAELARRVVPIIADLCSVFVVPPEGGVRVAALTSADAAIERVARSIGDGLPPATSPNHPVHRVLRTCTPILLPEASDAAMVEVLSGDAGAVAVARAAGAASMMLVPMVARGHALGAIGLARVSTRQRFDARDLALVEDLARRAALAVDNAQLLGAEQRARAEAEASRMEAEKASRAKSEFLAMMSHELRTPLNAIAGYSELLEMGLRGPVTGEQQEDLRKIRHNQRHLLGLINSVLNFARLDAGRVPFDLSDVPVDPTIASMESLIEPQVRERGLTYVCERLDPVVTVRADEEKLHQILLNLLSNAVKFTPGGGHIVLSARVSDDAVIVLVEDSGIGIAEDKLASIFEPFVQVDRTLSRAHDGVGLGLAISRELARGMQGDLTVRSNVGAGSSFRLTLPRGADRSARREAGDERREGVDVSR
jgi:PAS domain S-box-containing protein